VPDQVGVFRALAFFLLLRGLARCTMPCSGATSISAGAP
jgi:hypothetical protein